MAAIAVDTNLFLLLIVGRTRKDFIPDHKRLQAYKESDYDELAKLLGNGSILLTTPNVLTEVSNLLVQGVREPLRSRLMDTFVEFVKVTDERFHPCDAAMNDPCFRRLGLADATWLCVLGAEDVLVTDDVELYNQLNSRGLEVVRFLPRC